MATTLTIKNVPDEVVRALRMRAAYNQRTLQEEVLFILKQVAKEQPEVSLDTLLARAEQHKVALEEAASKVRAAQEAEKEKAARRFESLFSDSPQNSPSEPKDA
ncbi:MAG: plasmid stabilization protein [Thermoleophilia bacterium]|nr:plasmid stabilization protein [Thermoleophilia bacterium]